MKITKEKVLLGFVLAGIATNPLTGQYVQLGIELLFAELFMVGSYISLASGAAIVVYLLWRIWDSREKTNIPAKSKTTHKAGKFLEA